MVAKSNEIKLTLKLAKETKRTYVYEMIAPNGAGIGSVYLPMLLFVGKPKEEMGMTIHLDGKE